MPRRNPLTHLGQGLLMGGADVVPGVSGGTVALIVGIYEDLVASVRAAASARFRDVEWALVLPLGLGIGVALAVGSLFIPALLEAYPVQAAAVFFGLIAGSLAVPWRRIARPGARDGALAVAAALVAFVLVGLPEQRAPDPSVLRVFASAAVAICAMILPGISGAFLLLVLGLYETTLGAVRSLDVVYLAVFAAGAVVGLGLFSRLLQHLLARHHDRTMAALVGLMAGSLRALWPWLGDDRGLRPPPADAGAVLLVVVLALAGFAAVRLLVRSGDAQQPLTRVGD